MPEIVSICCVLSIRTILFAITFRNGSTLTRRTDKKNKRNNQIKQKESKKKVQQGKGITQSRKSSPRKRINTISKHIDNERKNVIHCYSTSPQSKER